MRQEVPRALYKYKDLSSDGIEHVEAMLKTSQAWFSSPLSLNDPFDCRCVYDIRNGREEVVLRKAAFLVKRDGLPLADAVAAAEADIPSDPSELNSWQERQVDGHSRRAANTGIFCLSESCDDSLMWTHYTRHHAGVCLQFRVRDHDAREHIEFIDEAQPVEYADRCPVINVVRDEPVDIVRKAFLTKGTPFRHELEWRIVRYDQGPGLKPLPKGIIGAVILGCQIDRAHRDRIIKACSVYDGEVQIVQSILDPRTYGVRMEVERTV